MSKISKIEQVTSWKRVLNAARRTIGKKPLNKEPSNSWKAKMLLAEHSPIRLLEYDWSWNTIKQWVTAHLVRHHEGCEKFVHSQRGDRRAILEEFGVQTRDELPQGALNDMDMTANAQALINISRKRLCNCASKETREAWQQVKESIKEVDDGWLFLGRDFPPDIPEYGSIPIIIYKENGDGAYFYMSEPGNLEIWNRSHKVEVPEKYKLQYHRK